jgi:hypothetical protein
MSANKERFGIRAIVAKATKSPSFREQLRKAPKAAIEAEFGVTLPEGLTIKLHENEPNVMNLVLPEVPVPGTRELSTSQLEQVAGGMMKSGSFESSLGICPED